MNKKISIMVNITAVAFLANICGASFLGVYVTAIGVADVSAPEFYIGSAKAAEETLLINEKPSSCSGAFGISGEYRTFKTENLGGVDFNYIPSAEFSVRAKVATTTLQNLTLKFGYYKMSDVNESSPIYLCSAITTLNSDFQDIEVDGVCSGGNPTNVKRFFYEFKKDCLNCKYSISKCAGGFYTKIKLDK